MAERKPISKTLRFEVFKRDGFKCQYCGRSAPEVILEVDHILPVAEGGTNDIINLITSCKDCNRGKGKRLLSDTKTVDLQRRQLDEMNELREQAEMMIEWKNELLKVEDKQIEALSEYLDKLTGYRLNEVGIREMKKKLHEFGFNAVYEALEISLDQYYCGTGRSLEKALAKVGGICYNKRNQRRANE